MDRKRPEKLLLKRGRSQSFRAGSQTSRHRMKAFSRNESGAVAIITAILMVVLLGFLALVVDIGRIAVVQNELQDAADAAALAGARALMPLTGTGDPPYPMQNPPPCGDAINAAMATSVLNRANLKNISLDPSQVITGNWNFYTRTFTTAPCGSSTNAVKVTARMGADLSQGSLAMTFARIFGIDTMNPSATAIAATGCLVEVPKGTHEAGWLATNNDYLNSLWDNYFSDYWANNDYNPDDPNWKYTGNYYYFIIQPAKGSDSWVIADNVGFSLPQGNTPSDNPTPSVLNPIIKGDSTVTVNMDAGSTVMNLTNGEIASVINTIKSTLQSQPSLLENILVAGVNTDSYTQAATAMGFHSITITDAWKAGNQLPDYVINEMRTNDPSIDPSQLVGVIQFYMTPDQVFNGQPGDNTGNGTNNSNTTSLIVKLVK